MGATSEFRKELEGIRLFYLSTLEAYNSSFEKLKNSDFDTLKVTTTPKKSFDISKIDVNYYVMRDVHLRLMKSNQESLRLNILISLMACLESYLKGVVRIAFRSAPMLFANVRSNIEMDLGSVVRFENYSNLTSHYLDKEVRKIGEKGLRENGDYFKKHLGIDLQLMGVRWERLLEASKLRNAIIHSGGRQLDEWGVWRKIQISHWFIMQIIDDMYNLSIFIGKNLREKIVEHGMADANINEPRAVLLCSVDNDYFGAGDEFKGGFRFLTDEGRVMQLSDLGDIETGRIENKTLIILHGSVRIISAYIRQVRSRMKDRQALWACDYIYREDDNNPVASVGIINTVVSLIDAGHDDASIMHKLATGNHSNSVVKIALDISKNLPSRATLSEISMTYDRKYRDSPIEYSIGELADYFMLPRKTVWAALMKIRAESIGRRLELAHLSI